METREKLKHIGYKAKQVTPAVAFLGGFIWDSLTLGKVVTATDLWILSAYWVVAFLGLWAIARHLGGDRWMPRLTWIVQFCFGGLFSALVVFYFKSSGTLDTFLFVFLLAAILVGNEFLQDKYSRLTLSWTLFALSGAMLLNFLVPHLLGSVHILWFLLSCTLVLGSLVGLWKLSRKPKSMLRAPFGVVALLVVLYLVGLIPPVPMVLKQSLVCLDFEVTQGTYQCQVMDQGFFARLGLTDQRVPWEPGTKIHHLTSIFAPDGVEAAMEHRWYFKDPKKGWTLMTKVPFRMSGGRTKGWRLFSNKASMALGKWRVETCTASGAVLGYRKFRVVDSKLLEFKPMHPVQLD